MNSGCWPTIYSPTTPLGRNRELSTRGLRMGLNMRLNRTERTGRSPYTVVRCLSHFEFYTHHSNTCSVLNSNRTADNMIYRRRDSSCSSLNPGHTSLLVVYTKRCHSFHRLYAQNTHTCHSHLCIPTCCTPGPRSCERW